MSFCIVLCNVYYAKHDCIVRDSHILTNARGFNASTATMTKPHCRRWEVRLQRPQLSSFIHKWTYCVRFVLKVDAAAKVR